MAGVSLVYINSAGGTITGGGQSFVRVNGSAVAVVGDGVFPHGFHIGATMAEGSTLARINGLAICRAGDAATCGHRANGQAWFDIGG